MPRLNDLGQPIGDPVDGWTRRLPPSRAVMSGRYCRLEPLDPAEHTDDLWAAYATDVDHRNWTYLMHGPHTAVAQFSSWVRTASATLDPLFFAVVVDTALLRTAGLTSRATADLGSDERAVGVAAYLRISPDAGSIEVGHINFSPLLQRTSAATEAMYLMMKHAFERGYRRYEWKCDALNAPSRAAAARLGLSFEGVFRQALVYKGRNRDSAWYAAIDRDWPALKAAFETWLAPDNFDGSSRQRTSLSALTAPIVKSRG